MFTVSLECDGLAGVQRAWWDVFAWWDVPGPCFLGCLLACTTWYSARLLQSSINLITMSDAGHVLWKCSYASLFLSLILFFSLPATTVALNVSYSAPTQCGPFQIAWDDSVVLFDLSILPFNDRPVFPPSLTLIAAPRDPITKTYNYTFNELPLKSGTQFVVLMNYGFGAQLLLSPPDIRIQSAHTMPPFSPNSCRYWRCSCVFDPNRGRLVGFKLPFYRSLTDELILRPQPTHPVAMLDPDRVMERYKIPRGSSNSSTYPRWSVLQTRPSNNEHHSI